jgi:hypothetical protein
MKKLIFGALLTMAFSFQLNAQSSINAQAKAEVTSQLSISDNSGMPGGTTLNFGKVAVSASTAGTCTISTLNVATTSGGVNVVASTTSTAVFSLTGMANKTYAITIPASTVVTRAGGAETMTIDSFTTLPASAGADQLTGTLNGTGADNFTVGGRLNVNAAQADGVYNGTFGVTVAYN